MSFFSPVSSSALCPGAGASVYFDGRTLERFWSMEVNPAGARPTAPCPSRVRGRSHWSLDLYTLPRASLDTSHQVPYLKSRTWQQRERAPVARLRARGFECVHAGSTRRSLVDREPTGSWSPSPSELLHYAQSAFMSARGVLVSSILGFSRSSRL